MACIVSLLATLTVQNRLFSLGDIYLCEGILVYPFTYFISDIIAEVYGYKLARQVLWCAILSSILFALLIKLGTRLPYPSFWSSYATNFNNAMSPILRTALSGTIGIIAGQFINIYAITKWKILTRGRYFWLRSIGSSILGDVITVSLAIFGIFNNRISMDQILSIIFYELLFMIGFAIILSVPGNIFVYFLKKTEKTDVFDYSTNFNPFKFAVDS